MNETNAVHAGEADRWGGWDWRPPRRGASFRTCSYCGSINPDDLASLDGWTASWADRKYGWPHKFYINGIAPTDPEMLFCIEGGAVRPGESLQQSEYYQRVLVKDLTAEQRQICIDDGMSYSGTRETEGAYVGFAKRTEVFAKFYTVHLRDERLAPEVAEIIHARAGLEFEWLPDGRVGWRPYSEHVTEAEANQ